MLTVFVIGDVLGAGIYALVGEVAGKVGGAIWTSFLLAGVLAAFTATAYAELVTKYPQAAGAALYTHKAFKRPFLTFLVAFAVMCSGVASAATLATAFGGDYLSEFVTVPKLVVGARVPRRAGADQLPRDQGVGLAQPRPDRDRADRAAAGDARSGSRSCSTAAATPGARSSSPRARRSRWRCCPGASLAFFALIGFEDSVNVAEETKEPSRVFPPALFAGLGIALAIYIVVTLIAGMAVPADDLAASDGPLLEVVQLGPLAMNAKVFSAIALFALTNGALINMIMASRLIYGMSQQGIVPRAMGRVHAGRRTPWVAIVFVAALAFALLTLGDLESLADTTVLLLLCVFVFVNIAVLVLRGDRVEHEHWRAPTALPVLGALACAGLIVQKATEDAIVFAYAGGLLALGVVLWLISRALTGPAEPIDPAALVDD